MMNFTFANPLGLWALLGIPAVVAIHFLQRRSQRVTITTLFLLQQMRRESESGNRFERLRTSLPFWLQILMVFILAWLLAQPRWLKSEAMQRVAIVLDSSASMQAFRQSAQDGVRQALSSLIQPVAKAELTLLSSDPAAPTLYHGASMLDLIPTLNEWDPLLGVHDFAPSLRAARSLVGAKGVVLLITDHPPEQALPFEAKVVSVGEPTANVGWTGVTVENKEGQWYWCALVKNHSKTVQERQWQVEAAGLSSEAKLLKLAPDELQTLSGPFPGGEVNVVNLRLTSDALTLDDRLTLVRPAPKLLHIFKSGAHPLLAELFDRFAAVRSVAALGDSDLAVGIALSDMALPEQRHACLFLPAAPIEAAYLKGSIVAEAHPLVEGLNWQGLLVRENKIVPSLPHDRVLLWQGKRPLISLRQMPAGGQQLICQFDLDTSNARKLPALAVMLHRFLENIRREKLAPEAANFDLRERLHIAYLRSPEAPDLTLTTWDVNGKPYSVSIPKAQSRLLRAPTRPGKFEVKQGDRLLLTGAAHFADTREADLSQAKRYDEMASVSALQVETLHEADPNWRLWLLLVLAALLGSWWSKAPRSSSHGKVAVPA